MRRTADCENRDQIQKEVFSEKDKGEPIGVFAAYSDVEEGEIVTNKIAQLHAKSGYAYHDFAILIVRMHRAVF